MEQQDIKDILIEKYDRQLKRDYELQNAMIETLNNVIEANKKYNKFQLISLLIFNAIVLISFFVCYFTSDYSGEIKEMNSKYTYNENIQNIE